MLPLYTIKALSKLSFHACLAACVFCLVVFSQSQWHHFLLQSYFCTLDAWICASLLWLTHEEGSRSQINLSLYPTGCTGLLESHQSTEGAASTVAESCFSPVEGLLPRCDESINPRWRGSAADRTGPDWTGCLRHLGRFSVLPSSPEEADSVMGFVRSSQAGFVTACSSERPRSPGTSAPVSDRPWQHMLGPAGHAVSPLVSYGKMQTTRSDMSDKNKWLGLPPLSLALITQGPEKDGSTIWSPHGGGWSTPSLYLSAWSSAWSCFLKPPAKQPPTKPPLFCGGHLANLPLWLWGEHDAAQSDNLLH